MDLKAKIEELNNKLQATLTQMAEATESAKQLRKTISKYKTALKHVEAIEAEVVIGEHADTQA